MPDYDHGTVNRYLPFSVFPKRRKNKPIVFDKKCLLAQLSGEYINEKELNNEIVAALSNRRTRRNSQTDTHKHKELCNHYQGGGGEGAVKREGRGARRKLTA